MDQLGLNDPIRVSSPAGPGYALPRARGTPAPGYSAASRLEFHSSDQAPNSIKFKLEFLCPSEFIRTRAALHKSRYAYSSKSSGNGLDLTLGFLEF
jgi:hypothetical protein